MSSRAERYRRVALAAEQRAAQTTDLQLKQTFKDVAQDWLALAEGLPHRNGPPESLATTTPEGHRTSSPSEKPIRYKGK